MPKLSSTAPGVPPCLRPESAPVWDRLRNYVRHTQRRTLLVIRHDSPRLPRELPPLLAEESGRPLVTATVSDAEPDPMAAAIHAAPGGSFPAGCILTITGAEDLALKADDGSRAALYEFARRLDLRRDQFLPGGGIVLVWANARVFDALAEHALNFISRAAAVLTLSAAGGVVAIPSPTPSPNFETTAERYHLPPLPPGAPEELRAALDAFEELAVANELYRQGGSKIAHGLARFDAERERIEAGWAAALRWARLDRSEVPDDSAKDPVRHFALSLVAAFPDLGAYILSLRQTPRERLAWLEDQLRALRLIHDRRGEGNALGNLGNAHAALGDARKAIEFFEHRLVIAREIGDRRGEGSDLWNSAVTHHSLGNRPEALARAEAALRIFEAIEDPNAATVRATLAQWRTSKRPT